MDTSTVMNSSLKAGYLGGQKVLVCTALCSPSQPYVNSKKHGIFFKFAIDKENLFSGERSKHLRIPEKIAGHEIKGLSAYINSQVAGTQTLINLCNDN